MKRNLFLILLLGIWSVSCASLWWGGIGYFLAIVTTTYWVGGIMLLKFKRGESHTAKYGDLTRVGWYLTGIIWIFVTLAALRYANISLHRLVTLLW